MKILLPGSPTGAAQSRQAFSPGVRRCLTAMNLNQPHFTLLMAGAATSTLRLVAVRAPAAGMGTPSSGAPVRRSLRRHDLVGVLRHEPGRAMLVDWAGDTIEVLDEGA